jgi:hypothetical protein
MTFQPSFSKKIQPAEREKKSLYSLYQTCLVLETAYSTKQSFLTKRHQYSRLHTKNYTHIPPFTKRLKPFSQAGLRVHLQNAVYRKMCSGDLGNLIRFFGFIKFLTKEFLC